jgi:hypothetical protein
MSKREPLAALILCAWAGGLWTICGVVVPGLFWLIADHKLAGHVAAQFFDAQTVLGTVFGLMYWALKYKQLNKVSSRWLWTAIAAPLVFVAVMRPLMATALAAGDMARFGQLHGVAGSLFLLACIAVAILAWRTALTRRAG